MRSTYFVVVIKSLFYQQFIKKFLTFFHEKKIRMEKFSLVSKIYTKNSSKIEKFYFHFNINAYSFYELLCSCKIIASFLQAFCCSFTRNKNNLKYPNSFEDMIKKPSLGREEEPILAIWTTHATFILGYFLELLRSSKLL